MDYAPYRDVCLTTGQTTLHRPMEALAKCPEAKKSILYIPSPTERK